MYTKEDLEKHIGIETDNIERIQRQADERSRQMQAQVNNAIGQCQGKLAIYNEILEELKDAKKKAAAAEVALSPEVVDASTDN